MDMITTTSKSEALSLIDFAKAQGFSTSKAIKLADSFLVIIYT